MKTCAFTGRIIALNDTFVEQGKAENVMMVWNEPISGRYIDICSAFRNFMTTKVRKKDHSVV